MLPSRACDLRDDRDHCGRDRFLQKPEQELELLDSPGIIPARQEDQNQALKLAICNDIGQASYDTQVLLRLPGLPASIDY